MKRIATMVLLTVASLLTLNQAWSQEPAVQASIPFAFAVSGKVLPSGTYTITEESTGLIMIQNRDTRKAVLSVTSFDSRNIGARGKLVFNKYGDQYFLREVLCADAGMSVNLPASKLEQQARTQEAKVQGSDEVMVAAK